MAHTEYTISYTDGTLTSCKEGCNPDHYLTLNFIRIQISRPYPPSPNQNLWVWVTPGRSYMLLSENHSFRGLPQRESTTQCKMGVNLLNVKSS